MMNSTYSKCVCVLHHEKSLEIVKYCVTGAYSKCDLRLIKAKSADRSDESQNICTFNTVGRK